MKFNIDSRKMFIAIFVCCAVSVSARSQNAKPTALAQKIVDNAHAKHPETSEIGIATVGLHGCSTIASTDKSDIGEKCEKDDSEPMQTGKPFVEKEKNSFDVSLPLHDLSGKLVGSVGIEMVPKAGQAEQDAIRQAQAIACIKTHSRARLKSEVTRVLWTGHDSVAYRYTVDGKEYTAASGRSYRDHPHIGHCPEMSVHRNSAKGRPIAP